MLSDNWLNDQINEYLKMHRNSGDNQICIWFINFDLKVEPETRKTSWPDFVHSITRVSQFAEKSTNKQKKTRHHFNYKYSVLRWKERLYHKLGYFAYILCLIFRIIWDFHSPGAKKQAPAFFRRVLSMASKKNQPPIYNILNENGFARQWSRAESIPWNWRHLAQ